MDVKLSQLTSLSQRDKLPAYSAVLSELLSRPDQSTFPADIRVLVDHVVNQESVGLVVGRQILSDLTKALGDKVIHDPAIRKEIARSTLDTIQPRLVSYEEQVNSLRFQLADIYEAEEEWTEAARILMGISMDSGPR